MVCLVLGVVPGAEPDSLRHDLPPVHPYLGASEHDLDVGVGVWSWMWLCSSQVICDTMAVVCLQATRSEQCRLRGTFGGIASPG